MTWGVNGLTRGAFERGIFMLRNTFGVSRYPQERVNVFWESFQYLEDDVFEEGIKEVVANEKYPPMFKEIQMAINTVKNRMYRVFKSEETKEIKNFTSQFEDSNEKWAIESIIKRVGGDKEDEQWSQFLSELGSMIDSSKVKFNCKKCEDTFIEEVEGKLYRCSCAGLPGPSRPPSLSHS